MNSNKKIVRIYDKDKLTIFLYIFENKGATLDPQ